MFNAITGDTWMAYLGADAFGCGHNPLYASGKDTQGVAWDAVICPEALEVHLECGATLQLALESLPLDGARAIGRMFITTLTNTGSAYLTCRTLGLSSVDY